MNGKEIIRQIRARLAIKERISVVFRLFPIRKNKVVFDNFNGRGYGDDPKYICEALHRKDKSLDLVWLLRGGEGSGEAKSIPAWVRIVPYGSFAAMYEQSTARIWVDNVKTAYKPRKRKGQFYLQTWHSSIGLKRHEADAEKVLPASYLEISRYDASITDLMYSNNDFRRNKYQTSFYYHGPVIKCGVPRCSVLVRGRQAMARKVREYFSIPREKMIVLYVPTFRVDRDVSVYRFDHHRCLAALNEHYYKFMGMEEKADFVMLMRLHPNVAEKAGGLLYGDDVKNATMYPDIQELMAAADVVISDYSDCIFCGVLMKIPVFTYTPDVDEYCSRDRGFYFKKEELPFTFNESEERLEETIAAFSYEAYVKKCEEFDARVGLEEDGDGDNYVAGLLLDKIRG